MSEPRELLANAAAASTFLKALANEHRLVVLCLLAEGERTVSELEALIGIRQPTLSQQLARLRADRLVETRRDGKSIYYSLADPDVRSIVGVLHDIFCKTDGPRPAPKSGRNRKAGA